MSARMLIITDNAMTATAIRHGVRHAALTDVIGYLNSTRPCGEAAAQLAPDVVIIDETRSLPNVLDRITEVRAALPTVRIILLAAHMEAAWLAQAAGAGIDAAVRRTADGIRVGALLRDVVSGDVFNTFVERPPYQPKPEPTIGLTGRETQILRMVAAGASNNAIAKDLWVTEQTVKFHLSNVYRKLGVANRTQASRYAHLHGLIDQAPAAQHVPVAA